jgi:hypothetical protein
MEREDETQFETATVHEELQAEESRGGPRMLENLGSDGEALALHEI